MRQTKKLTLTAILSALTVVLLTLGSLLEMIDLSMAAIASCFVIFLRLELGGAYPYLFWGTSSILSLILLPSSGAGLFFALLGLYPLLKAFLERLHPLVEWTIKLLFCALVLSAYVLLAKFVFLLPDTILSGWPLVVFLIVACATFILYDIGLSRLIVFYSFRIRPRIVRFLK